MDTVQAGSANARKIVVVTGSNSGIGFAILKSLLQDEGVYEVLACARSRSKAETAVRDAMSTSPTTRSIAKPFVLDLESDESIEALYTDIASRYSRIDVLLHNAGRMDEGAYFSGKMSHRDLWSHSWNTNCAGPSILTQALAPLLLKSPDPRLIFNSSGITSMEETVTLPSGLLSRKGTGPVDAGWPKSAEQTGMFVIRCVKAGLNMNMRHWERMLKSDGVKVWGVSPGLTKTAIDRASTNDFTEDGQDPMEAAKIFLDVIKGFRDDDVGLVVRKGGIQPW